MTTYDDFDDSIFDDSDYFGDEFAPDCRVCPRHPHVVVGSPCGMFDGLCGECEGDADFDEVDPDAVPFVEDPAPVTDPVPVTDGDILF